MIKCKVCDYEFDDTKLAEVTMGGVKCPNCGTVIDQEGNTTGGKKQMENDTSKTFFSKLVKERKPYIENRGAVAVHNPAKADKDKAWDGTAAVTELRKWASADGTGDKDKINWSKYKMGFGWYDETDRENFGSYKLPHHTVEDGTLKTVWHGVVAAMAALNGAREEVKIPDEDRKPVYNHLSAHYRQFDEVPPELK